ncbi:unnamed protein product [Arabidopsis halleri]
MSSLSCGSKWWRLAGRCSQIASLALFIAAAAVVWRCFVRLHLSFEALVWLRRGSVGRGLCVSVCCRCCRFSLHRFGQEEIHFRALEVFGWSQCLKGSSFVYGGSRFSKMDVDGGVGSGGRLSG